MTENEMHLRINHMMPNMEERISIDGYHGRISIIRYRRNSFGGWTPVRHKNEKAVNDFKGTA